MKKVLLLMTAVMAVSLTSVQAQKKAKDAEKAQKEMQTAALIDRIVPAKNFQFVPYEFMTTNGGLTQINTYEASRVRPDSFSVKMNSCPDVETNRYDWSAEKKKDVWNVKIKAIAADGSQLSFDFAINSKTGMATLRLRSNKGLAGGTASSITYRGNIREY